MFARMHTGRLLFALALATLTGCGQPAPGPRQARGAECNYTLSDACAAGLYCYSEELDHGAVARMRTWGFPGSKQSVAVGRCEAFAPVGERCSAHRRCAEPATCAYEGGHTNGTCR